MRKIGTFVLNVLKWIYGFAAAVIGVPFTLLLAAITIPIGLVYALFDLMFKFPWDSPLPYVSNIYHTVLQKVLYQFAMRSEMTNIGEEPRPHTDNSVIFVPGNHPPLLLLTPYYYLICKHICSRLLVTVKRSDNVLKDAFVVLMAVALWSMKCVALLARGKGSDLKVTIAGLKKTIAEHVGMQRALTLFVCMSRPNKKSIAADQVKFAEILREKYGREYDMTKFRRTLVPRIHAFAGIVVALPEDARVSFLFMFANKQIWSAWALHTLPGIKIRYKFKDIGVKELKQRNNESEKEWLERLTFFLLDLWSIVNDLQVEFEQS